MARVASWPCMIRPRPLRDKPTWSIEYSSHLSMVRRSLEKKKENACQGCAERDETLWTRRLPSLYLADINSSRVVHCRAAKQVHLFRLPAAVRVRKVYRPSCGNHHKYSNEIGGGGTMFSYGYPSMITSPVSQGNNFHLKCMHVRGAECDSCSDWNREKVSMVRSHTIRKTTYSANPSQSWGQAWAALRQRSAHPCLPSPTRR